MKKRNHEVATHYGSAGEQIPAGKQKRFECEDSGLFGEKKGGWRGETKKRKGGGVPLPEEREKAEVQCDYGAEQIKNF